jgi:hypothetical protein
MKRRLVKRGLLGIAWGLTGLLLLAGVAEAQVARQDVPSAVSRAGRFVGGAYLGLQAGTLDGEAFALGGNLDYYFTNELSVGPLLQMGLTGDLFQLGLSGQVKYTMDVRQLPALKPHVEAGIGFVYASFENGRDEDDVSFLLPLGFGLEYRVTRTLSLDTTVLLNFTDLDVGKEDGFFLTWLVGVRMPF